SQPAPPLIVISSISVKMPASRRNCSLRSGRLRSRSIYAITRPIQLTGCPIARNSDSGYPMPHSKRSAMNVSRMNMREPAGGSVADVIDHGGSLTRAKELFPNASQPWLDLSTGISPHPYPFGPLQASAYTRLPENSQLERLLEAAAHAYGVNSPKNIVAAPGTQILLPLVAELVPPGQAAILSPTYAEHARTAALAGHTVSEVQSIADLRDANYGVLVNPNNPDGRIASLESLRNLATELRRRSGLLMVDEAFMDV